MAQMLGLAVFVTFFFFHSSPALSALNGLRRAKQEYLLHSSQNRHLEENTLAAMLPPSGGLAAEVQGFHENFIVNIGIGSPPVPFPALLSTLTDLTWTQCQPCHQCFNQPTTIFNSSKSSSFSKISCNQTQFQSSPAFKCTPDGQYIKEFVSSSTQGFMGTETLTFQNTSVPGVVFGCGTSNTFVVLHGSGIIGLSRGPLSVVSQLSVKKFSYCLPEIGESNGRLCLGSQADFRDDLKTVAQSTPFVQNAFNPTFYYLSLKGLTLGQTLLAIPTDAFKVREDGTGGMIISASTMFSRLEKTAFGLLKEELKSQLGLPFADGSSFGYDVCFSFPPNSTITFPKLIYNFEGADLVAHVSTYLVEISSKNLLCMMISESADGRSVLGNLHQQNLQLIYDLENEMLSFAPVQCSKI